MAFQNNSRIAILDGFRCLCIICVILFHYFVRFAVPYLGKDYYPYHDRFYNVFIFRYGYLGVQCFFIISGFVIFMTLQKCENLKTFALKRFIRLWPILFICTGITYLVLLAAPIYDLKTKPDYLLPSLTITEPWLWLKAFRMNNLNFVDGVEWSLACEVNFYIIAGVLYFLNKNNFFRNYLIYAGLSILAYLIVQKLMPARLEYVRYLLYPTYLTFFAVGICFYQVYAKTKLPLSYLFATCILFLFQMLAFQTLNEALFIISFTVLFLAFIYKPAWLNFLSKSTFKSIGLVSYTLYLLHNNVGIVLINKFANLFNSTSPFLTALPSSLIIIGASFCIESMVNTHINPILRRMLT